MGKQNKKKECETPLEPKKIIKMINDSGMHLYYYNDIIDMYNVNSIRYKFFELRSIFGTGKCRHPC